MSVSLDAIDCPCLDEDARNHLIKQYSIHTTNDFLLWLIQSPDSTDALPAKVITCIQSCILAHTAQITQRIPTTQSFYHLGSSIFDKADLFHSARHAICIYESFNQAQWNDFFNVLLLRLFLVNPTIKIKYINTNSSLFDLHYFYNHYCLLSEKSVLRRDQIFEQHFYFEPCFALDAFEEQLQCMETNAESMDILLIDDLFALIKPYLNLDRRIKSKVLQLTRRLNRLAQKQSLLVISGLIFNSKKQSARIHDERYSLTEDVRFEAFHADKHLLLRSVNAQAIEMQLLNERSGEKQSNQSRVNLQEWIDVSQYTLNQSR